MAKVADGTSKTAKIRMSWKRVIILLNDPLLGGHDPVAFSVSGDSGDNCWRRTGGMACHVRTKECANEVREIACVSWELAVRRSTGRSRTHQDSGDAVSERGGRRGLDQEADKIKMVDSRLGPVGSLQDAEAAVVIAAAIQGTEPSLGRGI